jgi:hypothetical protein
MNRILSCGLLVGLVTACGCGAPFANDSKGYAPLATVHGQLDKDPAFVAPTGNVRVAVLWMSLGKGYQQAIDLPVQPVFPSEFKIELTEPPPMEMFADVNNSPGFHAAVGALIAYEDINQNGKLDLVDGVSPAFVDRVLGANGNLTLTYIDGTLPITNVLKDTGGRLPPTLGYNILWVSCSIIDQSTPAQCGEKWEWKTMSDPYQLTLTSDPHLAPLMCKERAQTGICAY